MYAQCDTTTITCLSQQTQHFDVGHNWYTSHGNWSISTNNAPTSTIGGSISMWSHLNQGSGAFTCFKFQKNHKYRVCFWVRNNSGWPTNPYGRLYVYAASSLTHNGGSGPAQVPYTYKQLISQSYFGPPAAFANPSTGATDWEFVTDTFTAQDSFNYLWMFPLNPNGPPPPGPPQHSISYILEVDDIRVEDVTTTPPPVLTGITGTNTITGCNTGGTGQTTLTIGGMPSTYRAIWSPSVVQTNPTGNVITARPCSTTTYKVEVYDPASACGSCLREILYYTVNVTQWSDPSLIVYPSAVACNSPIVLDYNDPGTCPGTTYTWIDPQGTIYSGKSPSPITATALLTGEWTLQVWVAGKSCAEEHKFFISVGSCCVSNPNFTFTPNTNPMSFNNTSTGSLTHIATLWNFGDGTTSDVISPTHGFNTSKDSNYWVCLTMMYKDAQGESCCERKCSLIFIPKSICAVKADFTHSQVGSSPNTFDFFDASTGNGTLCKYEWFFGDGTPSVVTAGPTSVRHSMATAGPWWVCLKVTNCTFDINGNPIECVDTKCMWVNPPPTTTAQPNAGDPVREVQPKQAENQSQPVTNYIPQEPTKNGTLSVYPNPNQGSFILSLHKHSGNYQVMIKDKLGREVYNQPHEFLNGSVMIDIKDVATGIYTVEVTNGNQKFIQQVSIFR